MGQGETSVPPDHTSEIVTSYVGAAMLAASIPVPGVDVAAVTAVQIALVRRLARRYDVPYDALRGRAAVLSLVGASLARVGASAVKGLPGAGWLLGSAAQAVLSGGSTWALGRVYREHFEACGSLDDVDVERLRERYREALRRGRDVARALRRQAAFDEAAVDERADSLARLARLRRAGILTQDEYERLVRPLPGEA